MSIYDCPIPTSPYKYFTSLDCPWETFAILCISIWRCLLNDIFLHWQSVNIFAARQTCSSCVRIFNLYFKCRKWSKLTFPANSLRFGGQNFFGQLMQFIGLFAWTVRKIEQLAGSQPRNLIDSDTLQHVYHKHLPKEIFLSIARKANRMGKKAITLSGRLQREVSVKHKVVWLYFIHFRYLKHINVIEEILNTFLDRVVFKFRVVNSSKQTPFFFTSPLPSNFPHASSHFILPQQNILAFKIYVKLCQWQMLEQ